MDVVDINVNDLKEYENNPRKNDAAVEYVAASIKEFGFKNPIIIDKNNVIAAGHTRLKAAQRLGMDTVPCIRANDLTDEQIKAFRIADNKTAEYAEWDMELLDIELDSIIDIDMGEFGFVTNPYAGGGETGSLERDFIVPPFSLLDGRQGYWKDRKAAWREKIKDAGEARSDAIIFTNDEINVGAGMSLLDPVLAECMLEWFALPQSKVFDCFAGDTVFGYVAGAKGHTFTGIELREEQAEFNRKATSGLDCNYITGDAVDLCDYIEQESQDMFFSCPPYYNLEVYSDLENDASNKESYEDFYKIIDTAFTKAITRLKENRFAVVAAANMRDSKTGEYYNFVGDIINTFTRGGMSFYNDMILADPLGSAGVRARPSMKHRKVVKVHQNILVFYKGDPKMIKELYPEAKADYDCEDE